VDALGLKEGDEIEIVIAGIRRFEIGAIKAAKRPWPT
jgi:hypothetical protein